MPNIENPASLVFGRDSWRGPHSYRCKCYKNLLKHPGVPASERHVAPKSSRNRRLGTAYSFYFRGIIHPSQPYATLYTNDEHVRTQSGKIAEVGHSDEQSGGP